VPSKESAGAPSNADVFTFEPRFLGADQRSLVVERVEIRMSWREVFRPVVG
jgi:hypothetical protein